MGLGFAKDFIIFIVISILLSIATKNPWNGVVLMILYAVVKIIWRILH